MEVEGGEAVSDDEVRSRSAYDAIELDGVAG
jgi:hypothetical protein